MKRLRGRCSHLCLLLAVLFCLSSCYVGNIWSDTPMESLLSKSDGQPSGYKEIYTEYIGENGSDGAVICYTEYYEEAGQTLINVGECISKKSRSGYVYYLTGDFGFDEKSLSEEIMQIVCFSGEKQSGYIYGLTNLSKEKMIEKYTELSAYDINVKPIEFELDGKKYSLNYLSFSCGTKEDAQNLVGLTMQ